MHVGHRAIARGAAREQHRREVLHALGGLEARTAPWHEALRERRASRVVRVSAAPAALTPGERVEPLRQWALVLVGEAFGGRAEGARKGSVDAKGRDELLQRASESEGHLVDGHHVLRRRAATEGRELEQLDGARVAPEDDGLGQRGTQLERVREERMEAELRRDAPLQVPQHARGRRAPIQRAREGVFGRGADGILEGLAQPLLPCPRLLGGRRTRKGALVSERRCVH